MGNFAKGKYAYGICDRTGFRYKLSDLKNQIIDQRRSGLLVGYAWNPIGGWNSAYGASNLSNMFMKGKIGKLTITTS